MSEKDLECFASRGVKDTSSAHYWASGWLGQVVFPVGFPCPGNLRLRRGRGLSTPESQARCE